MKLPAHSRDFLRRLACTAALGLIAVAPVSVLVCPTAASAQITVFDPTNYAQNLLSATRALTQINNQIRSLQNQAAMLTNMSKNLSRIDFPELQQLNQSLQQISQLMGQAKGIGFQAGQADAQFQHLFPQGTATTSAADVAAAKARFDAAMAAYRQTIAVQSQVAGGIQSDSAALTALAAKSQGAEGALQVSQATNQLLALTAKQQAQIQSLLAAQYRADALEQARRLQAESDGRAATARFLGSGSAYTPQ